MLEPCSLVLSDGRVLEGGGFGQPAPFADELAARSPEDKGGGEVIFNTAMCGYHEVLTDPSYTGQIVMMTYPHIGNYGDDQEWTETAPEGALGPGAKPRPEVKAAGYVVRDVYTGPLMHGRKTLDQFLRESGTPGISGIDTRALTLSIRDRGCPLGVLVRSRKADQGLTADEKRAAADFLKRFPSMEGANLIGGVGTVGVQRFGEGGKPRMALIDCGLKYNILRILLQHGCAVTVFPSSASAADILAEKPDAVFLSNGPGDPRPLTHQVRTTKELLGKRPVVGICLGHQILSLALGGAIYKMPFGHHGVNHPVRDEITRKVFVTSQNHGFASDIDSLPKDVVVRFRNANDMTVEGLQYDKLGVFTTQFHPEAAPGPEDAHWIFGEFIARASGAGI